MISLTHSKENPVVRRWKDLKLSSSDGFEVSVLMECDGDKRGTSSYDRAESNVIKILEVNNLIMFRATSADRLLTGASAGCRTDESSGMISHQCNLEIIDTWPCSGAPKWD